MKQISVKKIQWKRGRRRKEGGERKKERTMEKGKGDRGANRETEEQEEQEKGNQEYKRRDEQIEKETDR